MFASGLLNCVIVVFWVGLLLAIFMDLTVPVDRLLIIVGAMAAIPFALACQGCAL
ncbi:MAG: putative membrane protein [Alcanivorax borkumensis]|jgi:putative membrane protein